MVSMDVGLVCVCVGGGEDMLIGLCALALLAIDQLLRPEPELLINLLGDWGENTK
jgi:hypothetical protein